ncbi:MAG TPA: hypothetical protein PKA28_03490 [Methylomusa anaerophila]|uniref:Uncharacterized protein n=1 Tax=Methylomusa anaerophila TaxID=1930071 RepID=A0A348ANK9_9FIRM|nr:hypothetical protein [Methylomusa anaerophila]BBB92657.1 hypothetical protein MAMMFC1_03352 [Methylomusa anaerophila]HML87490.1 hypothetical protein [Methylomusa anaerophila]
MQEKVCPLCNALQAVTEICPNCGENMVDGGGINDYVGPYSPYMDSLHMPLQNEGYCLHLLFCPACKYDTLMAFALITV